MAQDTVIVKAGSQQTVSVSGRFFTVISATAKFNVELGNGVRREVRAGSQIGGEVFSRISFYETQGLDNTITFDAGDSQYQGEIQVSGVSGDTFDYPFFGDVTGSPPNTGEKRITTTFVKLPYVVTINGVSYIRKSFHLGVLATTGPDLQIFDENKILLDILGNGARDTFYFTQDVYIKGSTGSVDVSCYFTLYKTPPQ